MKKRLISLLLVLGMLAGMLTIGIAEEYSFADDDGTGTWTWAGDYIYDCYEEGIINGYEDGTYLPDGKLTRAEAAKIIAVTFGLSSDASVSSFSDVSADHWALQYIEACVEAGIINGYEDGTFLPGQNVTRAEMAKMIAAAAGLSSDASAGTFSDVSASHWALPYIEACYDAGIITGYEDGTFLPGNNITRAEAAAIISRVLGLMNADEGDNSNSDGDEEFIAYYQDIDPETVAESEDGFHYVTSQLLVVAEESASFDEVEELFSAYDGEIVGYISFTDDYQIQLEGDYTYEELKALCGDLEEEEILESVTLSYVSELTTDSVDYTLDPWIDANDASDTSGSDWDEDNPEGKNWWAEAISMPSVWNMDLELETVKVGIIDSMFDTTNEDLDDGLFAKLWNNEDDVSAVYESALAGTGTISVKSARHGTHVAGLIAAQAENYFGIAGVSQNAELYGYATRSSSYDSTVEAYWGSTFAWKYAIALMLNEGVKVINISMGFDTAKEAANNGDAWALEWLEISNASMSDFLLKYIDSGYEFLICKAAGNIADCDASYDLLSGITEERVKERIIVVGAAKCINGFFYEEDDYCTGSRIDVYAPGVDILSDAPTNITITLSGTSMATPIVSGIAALIWGVNPDLSASQVREIIIASQSVSAFQEEELSSLAKIGHFYAELISSGTVEYTLTSIVDAYFCVSMAQTTDGTAEDLDTSYGTLVGVIYALDENGDVDGTTVFSNLEVMLYDEDGNIISSLGTTYSDGIYTFSALLDPGSYTITISADESETQTQTFTVDAYDVLILSFDMTEYKENTLTNADIPDDAVEYNGHYYMLYDESLTWEEAAAACEALGGYLATITSEEENEFITTLLNTGDKYCYWLGGTDENEEGVWSWLTGEDWSYENWNSGEPTNHSDTDDTSEDYLTILKSNSKWNDLRNNGDSSGNCVLEQIGYICEWDSTNDTDSDDTGDEEQEENTLTDANIPDDAVEYNGHYYYLFDVDEVTSGAEAIAYCESLGGYLASITTEEEDAFLYAYITSRGYTSAYFGLTDQDEEGTWVWVSGETVDYTNWASGEPNGQNSSEDFAMYYYKYSDGSWNDGDFRGSIQTFICEWG